MAEFLAYRIATGRLKYENVPDGLKEKVKKILIESGLEELAK